jgi:hypothetical protein
MMPVVLYVSFHGGPGGCDNLGAYADDGSPLSSGVLQGAPDGALSELRAFRFVADGLLWVLSGGKHASSILAFRGSGTSFEYASQVATFPAVDSLWHPFDFTVSGSTAYVSAQDTNVVARLDVAADMLSASAAAVAPALPASGTFLAGTFVASADGKLPHVPDTTPVSAADGGLEVAIVDKKVTNSVRGVLWTNGALYVADEVGGLVRVYDADGAYLGGGSVPGPVHLMSLDSVLYVCNGSEVLAGALDPNSPASLMLEPIAELQVPKVSGLAYDGSGTIYAGSRAQDQQGQSLARGSVYTFTGFPSAPVAGPSFGIADAAEFVLYVADSGS